MLRGPLQFARKFPKIEDYEIHLFAMDVSNTSRRYIGTLLLMSFTSMGSTILRGGATKIAIPDSCAFFSYMQGIDLSDITIFHGYIAFASP